ncbi:MAG: SRPBCC family protein [Actinomycetota bacterium]
MEPLVVAAERTIDAPVSVLWEIVADLDGYHRHVEALAETAVVEGAGRGAIRRCVDASGAAWSETCTVWEPERCYVIEVDVATYPLKYRSLFRSFRGTWNLEPAGRGTRVSLSFDIELRRVPGASSLLRRLTRRARADLEAILASYAVTAARRSTG